MGLQKLAALVDGEVIAPSHPEYHQARLVWNAMIDRYPAAIVRCRSTADVVAAVRYCAEFDQPLSVRGGGHNVAGAAVRDDGVVIDLTEMNARTVDPIRRQAVVEGGATWGQLDCAAQSYGLATTGGLVSTTGVGGLTLGGGVGWLMRKHGLACDNLEAATVVTADGTIVRVDGQQNPDLLWALRGGGGNFGVVTEFTFALHPIGIVHSGQLTYPLEVADDVLHWYRDAACEAPPEFTVFVTFGTTAGQPTLTLSSCDSGARASGTTDLLSQLSPVLPVLSATVGPRTYPQTQRMLDAGFPAGRRSYWRSCYLSALDNATIETLIRYASTATSPLTTVDIEPMGGVLSEIPAESAAFPHRHHRFNVLILTMWDSADEDERHIDWTRRFHEALVVRDAGASYVNYLSSDADEQAVHAAYGASYDRLANIKKVYDPDNVFRGTQNVRPQGRCGDA